MYVYNYDYAKKEERVLKLIFKSRKGVISVLLVVCLLISVIACTSVANAAENGKLSGTAANNYYLWGLNTNDPDFGGMTAPTGSFSYDGVKGYYYFDLNGASGDYCFVVSTVNNSGAFAVKSPAVGGVQNSGKYYLSQGNYRGYACMHLWNPAGDAIRIYFTSEGAGLNAIPQSEVGETPEPTVKPTTKPQDPTSAPPTSGGGTKYIYCQNAAAWGEVYAYMWNGDGTDRNAAWPGVKMSDIGNGVWRYEYHTDFANVIFNSGSDANKTEDLVNPGSGKMYNNSTGQWSTYGGSTQPTTPVNPTTPANPTTPVIVPTSATQPSTPTGNKVIFCEDAAGWGSVYAYMWNSDADKNGQWPGVLMTKIGNNIWRYTVPKDFKKIIFNIGGSQTQTTDMDFPGYGYIYNNKTNEWSIYDTSPLQVQSFTTDLSSPQYAGVGITLSASATGEGTVRYKFSATSSSGTTKVIADYSTKNSAIWTPTSTGTYTLTYEFKDTAGNTNKRTLTYKVEDGSASEAPFIKLISPAPGQIKKAAACKVTVSAGGGNTGTKLLFYKYTVMDSAGKIVNVPYYTTSTSYSFTPSALGTYTVTVNVQGSNNDTVERMVAYESVNTVVTPTEPTDPPATAAPTVKPTEPAPTVRPTENPSAATMLGDADMNGEVNILDATRIQRYLVNLASDDEIDKANADVDHDNKVTILDATVIQRFLVGLVTKF